TGNMSTPRYRHAGTLLLSGKVLVTGGSLYGHQCDECLHSAELYDPATGLWTATGSMNFGRYWHTATLLASGKVLVAAGNGVASGYEISAELYDPATGTWTPTGSLLDYRKQHDATLLVSGKVLVTGGLYPFGVANSAELYDPATGSWTPTGSMSMPRNYHTATLLPSGKVLVAGGYNANDAPTSTAELYDE